MTLRHLPGIQPTRSTVQGLLPERPAGRAMSGRWRDGSFLFHSLKISGLKLIPQHKYNYLIAVFCVSPQMVTKCLGSDPPHGTRVLKHK